MRKKISTLLVGVVAASAALLAVPAEAAPAQTTSVQAVPIVQDQVVIYTHADYKEEITRRSVPTCTASGDYWQLNLLDASRISSVLLWVPNPTGTRCNRMGVQSADGPWYFTCISKWKWGIPNFGPGYNDNTWMVWVAHDPRCPAWNAPRQ